LISGEAVHNRRRPNRMLGSKLCFGLMTSQLKMR
jgi:hypothetical protein